MGTTVRAVAAAILASGVAILGARDGAAQDRVLPPALASTWAAGATHVPFGRVTSMRLQAAYDGSNLASPSARFTALGLRVDEALGFAGKRVELELLASTMPGGVGRLQPTFEWNRGADVAVVIPRRTVDLPAVAATDPHDFAVRLPLEHAFTWQRAAGSLLLEFVVHAQEPGGYALDSTWLSTGVHEAYGPAGCGAAGRPVLDADSLTTRPSWGRELVLCVRHAAAGAPTGLFFGLTEQGEWNGVPIPLELAPYGAPGCHLSIDVLSAALQPADATGSALFSMFVPSNPLLRGALVRFQGFSIEPGVNALGAITSRPYRVEIAGWEAVGRVFAAGADAEVGVREIGVAPVVQLRF